MITDFFCSLYSKIINKNEFLEKARFYSLLRFIVRVFANLLLPLYYILTCDMKGNKLQDNGGTNKRIIVSLTSFPARINRLWLVVETLLRQSLKPDMVILWLSNKQFDKMESLPKRLLKLQQRGLVIRFVNEDIRSHKKYFYALKEFPNDIVITVDDDVFYQSNILESLITAHKNNPNVICANHARMFHVDSNEQLKYSNFNTVTTINSKSEKYIQIGIGGVLYPPYSLHKDVLNKELFMCLAPMADDLWLYSMARLKGYIVYKTSYKGIYLPVININNINLSDSNCGNNGNDIQMKNIRDYYMRVKGIDIFG